MAEPYGKAIWHGRAIWQCHMAHERNWDQDRGIGPLDRDQDMGPGPGHGTGTGHI